MFFSKAVICIMSVFMLLGCIDSVFHNKLGLGNLMEQGLSSYTDLVIAMVGITCFSPLLSALMVKTIGRLFVFFGADVSLSAAFFLSVDTGCYPFAHSVAQNSTLANFTAVIVSSMLAPTIGFLLPISLRYLREENHPYLALGALSGFIAMPFAFFAGGLLLGLSPSEVLKNLFPLILLIGLLCFALIKHTKKMIAGIIWFAKGLNIFLILSLGIVFFQYSTGFILIPGLLPLQDFFKVICEITIILAGAYPFCNFLSRILKKPFRLIGKKMSVNECAVTGFVATLANCMATIATFEKMDKKGLTLNAAFASCASFAIGDHLGYCAAVDKTLILPMVASKLLGGFLAVGIACLLYHMVYQKNCIKKSEEKESSSV